MEWCAVYTKPRQERLAHLNIQNVGIESFYPQLKRNKVIRRKLQTVTSPLFPRYLFAKINMAAQYRALRYAIGVADIVSFGMDPVIIEDCLISSIKSRIKDGYVTLQPATFKSGEIVKITEGPFEGFRAIFEGTMNDRQRVALMLQALSYQIRVVVDREFVIKA